MPLRSRRWVIALFILGVFMIIGGLLSYGWGSLPRVARTVVSIPVGRYYYYFAWSILDKGHLDGNFSSLGGTPVVVYVFDGSSYSLFKGGMTATPLYAFDAVNVTLSVDVSGMGTYYVVITHAPAYTGTDQNVSVRMRATGVNPDYAFAAYFLIIVGAVLTLFEAWRFRHLLPEPRRSAPRLWPAGPPFPPFPSGTILVTVANQSGEGETVALFVNGVESAYLVLPTGTSGQRSLPVDISNPGGVTVILEAVTSRGQRAKRDVFLTAGVTSQVQLRIG